MNRLLQELLVWLRLVLIVLFIALVLAVVLLGQLESSSFQTPAMHSAGIWYINSSPGTFV